MVGDKGAEVPKTPKIETADRKSAAETSRSPFFKAAISKARESIGRLGRNANGGEQAGNSYKTSRELYVDLTPEERARVNDVFTGPKQGEPYQDADIRYDAIVGRVRSERPGATRGIFNDMSEEDKKQVRQQFGDKTPDESMQQADARWDNVVRDVKFGAVGTGNPSEAQTTQTEE